MKRFIGLTLAALLLGGVVVSGEQPGRAKNGKKNARHAAVAEREVRADVVLRVAFGARDVEVIRAHYGPRFRTLPPGLAKKVARGGSLPPGWQKKWEPFPVALERGLPPLPGGYARGVIDGHAVIYNSKSGTVVDVAVLF